ncbi:hypothetical protein, partial [Salmonella enterica]|uniref:hypothetical protein n=1 Tax=Salmonella enterica TaxID=28901 RepID=UPI00195F5B66
SSSAFADTTGTQTFTANVTANTCTITGLNQTIDLGTVNTTAISTDLVKFTDYSVSVAGCPDSVSNLVTKLNAADMNIYGAIPNAGSAGKGLVMAFVIGDGNTSGAPLSNNQISSKTTLKTKLTKGAGKLVLDGLWKSRGTDFSVGTILFNPVFAFDFE